MITTPPERAGSQRPASLDATLLHLRRGDAATTAADSSAGAAAERPPDADPATIGRYLVLRRLGAGGMGVVYAAYDQELDRQVAIKLLHDRAPDAQARLQREAQALARLSHPNVVAVHDVGVADGQTYIAMEFIAGATLRAWVAERPRSCAEVVGVYLQAARGLAAAHAVGMVHRDFKPDNAIIDAGGRVRVCDFGLVRPADGEADPVSTLSDSRSRPWQSLDATLAGTLVGTPAYMAPEQLTGRKVDARTDVFCFCISLYEGLYGARPWPGTTHAELCRQVLREPPPLEHRAVPPWLRAVLARGLQVAPSRRWQDMDALAAALSRDPVAARRRALRVAALVLGVAVVAAALPLAYFQVQRAWTHRRSERLADERLTALEATMAAYTAAGRTADADAAFTAYVEDPAHRGTAALVRAYARRGDRRRAAGQAAGALADYAAAYTRADDPAQATETARAMAGVFHETWSFGQLAAALDTLEAAGAGGGELAAMRAEESLIHRDFAGAAAALARVDDAAELAAARPLVAALTGARATGLHGRRLVDHLYAPGQAFALVRRGERAIDLVDAGLRRFAARGEGHTLATAVAGSELCLSHAEGLLSLHPCDDPAAIRWQGPAPVPVFRAAAADLDADGRREVYYGLRAPARGFYVLEHMSDGTWSHGQAHASTHASGADVDAIVAADLDGDGAEELAVAVGAWSAYDLRVFRRRRGEGLELLARHRLGRVGGLAAVRQPGGGALLLAAKDDLYPNPQVFPAAPHTGAPAGVYALRFTGRALEVAATAPFPRSGGASVYELPGEHRVVADLDGDGRDEYAFTVTSHVPGHAYHAAMLVQPRGEGLGLVPLGGLLPLGAAQLDDDPALELVVATHPDHAVWALGVGDEVLPTIRPDLPPAMPPPGGLRDPLLVQRWQRAEQLAAVGLHRPAAEALRAAADLTADDPARLALHARAADFFALAGELPLALELLRPLAARGDASALGRSADALARLGRFEDAHAAAAAMRAAAADDDVRAAADARLAALAPLVAEGARALLRFHRPLDPAWRVHQPTALRRDLATGSLRLTASAGQGLLAELPIEWDGGPLELELELEVEQLEFGAAVQVVVLDDAGRTWLGAGVSGQGGAGQLTRRLSCQTLREPTWGDVTIGAPGPVVATSRARLRVGYAPGDDEVRCVGSEADQVLGLSLHAANKPRAGRYRLALGSFDRPPDGTLAVVRLTSLALHGARLLPPTPADAPAARAADLLVEGRPAAALAALAAADPADRTLALWEAQARDDLRDLPGAAAALRRALAGVAPGDPAAPFAAAAQLLRARPRTLGAALRMALGADAWPWLARVWSTAAYQHVRDPSFTRAVVDEFADIDLSPETGPSEVRLELLLRRAQAWTALGDPARARADLVAALAAEPAACAGECAELALLARVELMRLLAADDPARTVALARDALARARAPELLRARLREDPALGLLRDDPTWQTLTADAE